MADSSEELRAMLRSADIARSTPARTPKPDGTSDVPLDELASLISSLDIDLGTPMKNIRNRAGLSADPTALSLRTELRSSMPPPSTPLRAPATPSQNLAGFYSEQQKTPMTVSSQPTDEWEFTVLKFGSECSLRGRLGKYLTAVPVNQHQFSLGAGNVAVGSSPPSQSQGANKGTAFQQGQAHGLSYALGVEGQGIGEPLDCFTFANVENRDDNGPIRYGTVVALKAPAAKERLLGVREGSKPGFWRNLIGQGEKWLILQAAASGRVAEEPGSRGLFVRLSDRVMLQCAGSDYLLSLHEGAQGVEPRLQHKDRAIIGGEIWQLDQFGAPALPAWHDRPYLSGRFLVLSPTAKNPSPEIEARCFPGSTKQVSVPAAPPLYSLSPAVQHALLLRDLLLALTGVEGQYVRVAAPSSTVVGGIGSAQGQGVSTAAASTLSRMMRELNLVVEAETADRSAASQVALLLPICESAVQIREFVRTHSRYEFGLVSQALSSAVRQLMREFDVLVAQLEHLLNGNRLSLQKMVYLLQPSKTTLRMLEKVVRRLRDSSGGRMIDGLHSCYLEQGDSRAKQLHVMLLEKASEPFLKMLSQWLFRGELQDPYKEFMIFEDLTISKEALQDDFNAQYWEGRYTLREGHVPKILRPLAAKALTAGKYLNVVRGCVGDGAAGSGGGGGGYATSATSRKRVVLVTPTGEDHSQNHRQDHDDDWIDGIDTAVAGGVTDLLSSSSSSTSKNHSSNNNNNNNSKKQRPSKKTVNHDHAAGDDDVLVIKLPKERKLFFEREGSDTHSLARAVEEAHAFSSRALLRLLEQQYGLSGHLRSLRRFFLLENGDFFIQFMDIADEELRKEAKDVALPRIQNLLQLAIQTSTIATDPHREDLSCSLAPHNLIQHLHQIQSAGDGSVDVLASQITQGLKGVEALTLDYRVGWPVSLVISRRAITKYQLLSRLLYFSKHVESRVLSSWQDHQCTRGMKGVRAALGPSYCLRHRMLHFLQNFVYYMTLEVIGPRGHELQAGLADAKDMDQVLGLHERFLDTCLKQCLLASQDLLKILTKLMTTCLLFADQMKRFMASAAAASVTQATSSSFPSTAGTSANPNASAKSAALDKNKIDVAKSEYIRNETSHSAFLHMLGKFEDTFDTQLKEFLERLWTDSYRHHPQLSNLCVRLDYNGYYTGRFAPDSAGGPGISGF